MGSPRKNGFTAELLKPFVAQLEDSACEVVYITLSDKNIQPCIGCLACQNIEGEYGCIQDDDVAEIMDEIRKSDCTVFATPIYTWYCTAPMKALLDRHFGLNKFYGTAKGSLWAGKDIAILATHGYETRYAVEPFELGIRRLCEHSKLNYKGIYSVRAEKGRSSFRTETAVAGAKAFALQLLEE